MSEQTKIDITKRIHTEKYGATERKTFSQIKNVLDIPDLIAVQKDSYKSFIEGGITDVLRDYSPIVSYSGKLELSFLGHSFDKEPTHTVKFCKENDVNYAVPLRVMCRLTNTETGEMVDQNVFMGDFPLMTESGSFIINGAERVVVSQLIRSPGVYCDVEVDKKSGAQRFSTRLSPERGAWLEYEQDQNGINWVHVDKKRKILTTTLLRSLALTSDADPDNTPGFQRYGLRRELKHGTDEDLCELFGNDPMMVTTCNKDAQSKCTEDGLIDLFRRMKEGEVPTIEGAKKFVDNAFFEYKKYDLTRVGRYKLNRKLSLGRRIAGHALSQAIVDPETGEVLADKGAVLSIEEGLAIQNKGVNIAYLAYKDADGNDQEFKVIGNNSVDLEAFIPVDENGEKVNPRDLGILEMVYYPEIKEIVDSYDTVAERILAVKTSVDKLVRKVVTADDIIATTDYNFGLTHGFGNVDDIDHLSNRRVRAVGELLQNQFRIGISRLERVVKEKMQSTPEGTELTPQTLINIRPVTSAIKEFFGSSQLSQFMDQPNPIAELTHKRKLSALGPGGLNRERATVAVRDVHHSHYGRMCPIETPEGQNIGLISSLSSYAKVNEYGYIESPYRKIDKATGKVLDEVVYMTADEEDKYIIAQANEPLDENSCFVKERVTCRAMNDIREYTKDKVDYMDVNPKQLVSIATALIPFLENDDTNRALMGSNMQRQAVPLLKPEAPIIATGVEYRIAHDSGVMKLAKRDGFVKYVDSDKIVVETADGTTDEYELSKFQRSNQSTCIDQRPIVSKGQKVKADDVLADGPATDHGELSLGRNILIGFMSWEGYNYEDAVLISEDLVKDDVFTSIHIEDQECEARDTKLGEEQITRDIPNLSDEALKNLDEDGVVRVGAEVRPGDILVGKVTPKGETELTPEERLLRAIFGEKSREVRDTSLRVQNGQGGIVVNVQVFTRKNHDELAPGVNKKVRVFIAQKRKISVGDKMAGRHGNKGVVSRVLPREDMPFMADGTPLQIVLNPLGVPSRMNIGQVLEVHLGLVAHMLDWKISTPVFDGAHESDIKQLFKDNHIVSVLKNPDGSAKLDMNGNPIEQVDGKIQLYDGRTGEPFENPVTVGYMYYLKLHHLVDDKIHARSTGPYSLVTQQPLGGKAQFGGQRFGEMEVWALEAYGAANMLQEILTVKSDDVVGRVKTYESIVKGNNISEPGIPESFKVLVKELQSLGLDVKVLTEDRSEVSLKDYSDEETDFEVATAKKEPELKEVDIMEGGNIFETLGKESATNFDNLFDTGADDEDIFGTLAGAKDDAADKAEDDLDADSGLADILLDLQKGTASKDDDGNGDEQ